MKTDAQLQFDVSEELNWDPSIHAEDIGVTVHDGVVTLTGHVHTFAEKWEAERASQRVAGVKALAVEVDVTLPGSSVRNDADIARSAQNVLEWNSYVPGNRVKVLVEDGMITLSGEVARDYQRRAATDSVRTLMGVKGVSNQMTLPSGTSSDTIKTDIEAALQRRVPDDAKHISVEVNGGDVTLTGTVHCWSGRDQVRHSVWGTAGVRSVKDRLTMRF
ncbi:MAG: BON domain-containing protein [Steroidobacteraceae bacterium]|jgi:osmotically-inducible protein OsmY